MNRVIGVAVMVAALTGCGSKGSGASQVVAKVNDSEITVSQLSQALHVRGVESTSPDATKQAIEALINEELLLKSALDNKLDRDPAVVQALERSRRQVLARAYVERMVFPTDAIGASEQVEFYKKHPELFEHRKMFQVTVFTVKAADITDDVRTVLTPSAYGRRDRTDARFARYRARYAVPDPWRRTAAPGRSAEVLGREGGRPRDDAAT